MRKWLWWGLGFIDGLGFAAWLASRRDSPEGPMDPGARRLMVNWPSNAKP